MTPDPWRDIAAARLPAAALAALAPARNRANVRVHVDGEIAWVCWPAGHGEVVRLLLPVAGAEFFARRGDEWFRHGSRLPTADAPTPGVGRPLAGALVPGRFAPTPAPNEWGPPVALTVARGGGPRPASALRCDLATLRTWADAATSAELAAVRGAIDGGRVLLLGAKLPALPGAVRYWGEGVLIPLGFRAEPDLPADILREAAGVADDELLILDEAGAEAVPKSAAEPLTRAGVRLATGDRPA